MRGIAHLFIANARMFFRVRQEIFWVFFLPVFMLILLGIVLKDVAGIGSLKPEDVNFPIGVVDNDHSPASRQFIKQLQSAPEFTVTLLAEAEAMEQAKSAVQRVVVIFPSGFAETLKRSEARVDVVTDSRALPLTEMALNILKEKIEAVLSENQSPAQPITFVRERVRSVEEFFSFIDFLVPGIIAMAVMPSCIFSLAPTVVRLREQGVMRRLWVTPLSRFSFVASHVLFRLSIAVAQTALIIIVALLLFRTDIIIPVMPLIVFVILGNLNGTAIAFSIAAFAKTPEVASTIANVVAIPMLMLCGVFLPLEIMPPKVLPLIWLLPLTHLSEGLRELMNMQKGFLDLWKSQLVLLAYLTALFLLSLLRFKWDKSTAR
ncbi:MAG: ABC transporter permease [Candidatus Abyssobacteria bacterium SURF_17]|uniref:ABC transporter permease n=1 Tax=Candidatus Abyssobacteria bacterium SURF_17 TaxID=2093361 RepID=A0A419F4I7_9BACT|nr:MAG: ABC transporter permease [Candidatus Abyssubacteria bacterium SURF_17]